LWTLPLTTPYSVIEASFIPSLHGRAAHTGGKQWIRLATAVVEDAMAPGGPEGIDLAVEHLPLLAGGHPSIADPFHRLAPTRVHA